MYPNSPAPHSQQNQNATFAEADNNSLRPPTTFGTARQYNDSLVDSPVPYPPLTQQSPDIDAQRQGPRSYSSSSIVYETPLRESLLQGLACYQDVFGNANAGQQQGAVANGHKRRKLT